MSWSFTSASGASGTFAAFGLTNLRRTRVSQQTDKVTFDGPAQSFCGNALFPYKDTVVIYRDGVRWFSGLVTSIPRQGAPEAESISYELSGPWYYLEKTTYRQLWQMYNGSAMASLPKSRCILNQSAAGGRLNSGAQITDALTYALSKFTTPPFAIGTIDPDVPIPWEELKSMSCAEVIMRQLRYSRDCATWFDYSQEVPVLHIRSMANLVPVSVEIPGSAGVPPATSLQSVSILPRYDLQVPGVRITYETTTDLPEGTFESYVEDVAGDVSAYDCLELTVQLAGGGMKYISQKIKTEDNPGGLALTKSFWRSKYPARFRGVADADFDLSLPYQRGSLPRVLVEGTVQDWMDKEVDTDHAVGATLTFKLKDDTGKILKETKRPIEWTFVGTDADTKTYRKFDQAVGEPVPVGLAAALYAGCSILHYDGSITLVESEVSGAVGLGNVLNLTGGREEWAAMAACVQRIDEVVDAGTTIITFGFPRHIEVDDLIEAQRNFRSASTSYKFGSRVSGKSTDDADSVDLSGPVPKSIREEAEEEYISLTIHEVTGGTVTKQYDFDPTLLTTDYQVLTVSDVAGVKTVRPGWVRAHA